MKKAFTVAEGLVTLIIVGVLASVMVTSVVKQKPDKNKIMMRNAYAELTGVVSQLVADSLLYPDFAEFGLGDDTEVTVHYGGYPFKISDNRGKMCIGIRHYFNTITQDYITHNVNTQTPCRASFYTKNGILVRFEVDPDHEDNYVRHVVMDVNPTNNGEFESGDDLDTLRVRIYRSGKMEIANSELEDVKRIITQAEIR